MGAPTFITDVVMVDDVKAAFDTAVERAEWEHGRGGYTGTIAEKDGYVVIHEESLPESEAYAFARRYLADPGQDHDNYDSVHCKWGPAGAIRIPGGWVFFGWASS